MALNNKGGGHPSLPVEIKKLHGTYKEDEDDKEAPNFDKVESTLEPPAWLDEEAKRHWRYHAPIFIKAGVITEADTSLLAQASERWTLYRYYAAESRKMINRGYLYKDINQITNLSHTMLMDYLAIMREFGVGPASRARVKVQKAVETDEFSDLFDERTREAMSG